MVLFKQRIIQRDSLIIVLAESKLKESKRWSIVVNLVWRHPNEKARPLDLHRTVRFIPFGDFIHVHMRDANDPPRSSTECHLIRTAGLGIMPCPREFEPYNGQDNSKPRVLLDPDDKVPERVNDGIELVGSPESFEIEQIKTLGDK